MSVLANEHLISAKGWNPHDPADTEVNKDDKYFEFADDIAITFGTTQGKKVLDAMVSKYLLCDIAQPYDTQVQIGIRQGRASVVKFILSQIEISNKRR